MDLYVTRKSMSKSEVLGIILIFVLLMIAAV